MKNNYLVIGSDFIDSDEIRTTSVQLVESGKGAIAVAFFNNGKLDKTISIDSVNREKFLNDAKVMVENSIPIIFKKQPIELEVGAF
jgi:hypothetical protein